VSQVRNGARLYLKTGSSLEGGATEYANSVRAIQRAGRREQTNGRARGLEGKGSTQRREDGSRAGVAKAAFLASVAALQGIVHEGTRSGTKASFAAIRWSQS